METKKNYLNELKEMNSAFGVTKSIGNKYDYANADIPKKLRFEFRKDVRKLVTAFYEKENVTIADLKRFASYQESILLACTVEKKKFSELSVSAVYPAFDKCDETEKKQLIAKHESFKKLLLSEKK